MPSRPLLQSTRRHGRLLRKYIDELDFPRFVRAGDRRSLFHFQDRIVDSFPEKWENYIVLPPRAAYVIVFDQKSEDDSFDVLPLLTMAGLRQSGNGASLSSAAEN